ncbi:hypothetical protein [Antrihabitans cavernicola]|uniref:Uncharacterized protein n=1 Tax=Antrihabitans cavernicola TaxID=2495913 RepID=A0A5A7SCM2_9NOCA|nr:hypothetical protein [Spelaeibacter cavernicola]KAA0022343.1 hypothetical protein FOY51_15355 [Spelaeibacter cavernicola]
MTTDETAGEPKQISVAELLARNGQKGGVNATEGGRRRAGVAGGITVAELTGEIPVYRDEPRVDAKEAPVAEKAPEPAKAEPVKSEPVKPEPANVEPAKPEPAKAEAPKLEEPKAEAPKVEAPEPVEPKAAEPKVEEPKPEPPATAAWPAPTPTPNQAPEPTAALRIQDIPVPKEPQRPTAWSSQSEPQLLAGSPTSNDLIRRPDVREDVRPEESTEVVNNFGPLRDPSGAPVQRSWMTKRSDDVVAPDDKPVVEEPAASDVPEAKHSNVRQWLVLLGQAVVAIVIGALLFKGFERLWDMLPWVALVLAVLVILGLVALVRILRKTDDLLSIVIAIVVGVFVTMGPLVFLLSTS